MNAGSSQSALMATPAVAATALANIRRGFAGRGSDTPSLPEVARQFESIFTHMVMKSMRTATRAISEGGPFNSFESRMFEDMMDEKMSAHLSESQGLGLAEILVRQLSPDAQKETRQRRPVLVDRARALPAQKLTAGGTGANSPAALDLQGHQPGPIAPDHGVAAGAGRRSPMFADAAAFVQQLTPVLAPIARQVGVATRLLLAQSALETGWGQHVIHADDGRSSHNLFGIKARSTSEPQVLIPSMEVVDGVAARRSSGFRAYSSFAESARDLAARLLDEPRYAGARAAGDDVNRYAGALEAGGYATDPAYSDKLKRMLEHPLLEKRAGAAP